MWSHYTRSRVALLISLLIAFGLEPLFPESEFTLGFLCGVVCPFMEYMFGDENAQAEGTVWLFLVAFFIGLSLFFTANNEYGMLVLSYSTGAMASYLYLFMKAKRKQA